MEQSPVSLPSVITDTQKLATLEEQPPCFSVGPTPTGRGETVLTCVWATDKVDYAGRKVYAVASYSIHTNEEGQTTKSHVFKLPQLPIVMYGLQKAFDHLMQLRGE